VVHGLIFTAVYSRHMFVWPTYRQTLADVIAGFEAAWEFFGGYAGVDTPVGAETAWKWARSAKGSADVVDTVPGAFIRSGR